LHGRTPTRNENPLTIQLPSARAGCGGIDVFAGSFSHINSDQLVALSKAVANQSLALLFDVALETISPMLAEKMGQFRALAEEVNQFNINSCEQAAGLVGSVWSKHDSASKVICQNIGNRNGLFTDYAAARHGCATGGERSRTLNQGGEFSEIKVDDVNLAWQSMRKKPYLAERESFAEFLMAMTGTVILRKAANDDAQPRIDVIPSRATQPQTIHALLNGGTVPVLRCDNADTCLAPTLATTTIAEADALKQQVTTLMTSILDKIITDARGGLSREELGFLNTTTLPVYKMLNVSAAYGGGAGAFLEIDTLAEVVAMDMVLNFLNTTVKEVQAGANQVQMGTADELLAFRAQIREVRQAIAQERRKIRGDISTAMSLIQRTQFMEKQLSTELSNTINLSRQHSGNLGQ
jgi:conjugative transfer pilus assembly protein TraH